MSKSNYCEETGCIRKVFEPYIYCDKHQDNNSTPIPSFKKGDLITLKGFGTASGNYRIGNIAADTLHLELCDE